MISIVPGPAIIAGIPSRRHQRTVSASAALCLAMTADVIEGTSLASGMFVLSKRNHQIPEMSGADWVADWVPDWANAGNARFRKQINSREFGFMDYKRGLPVRSQYASTRGGCHRMAS